MSWSGAADATDCDEHLLALLLMRGADGRVHRPQDLAHISPYLAEHINRFGEYSTHELGIQPDAYDLKLDVDFTLLREQDLTAAGLGQAA
ncbi:hypothetical protein [Streptomyces sp. NPDC101150]|uniref:hypothetical protein n=1 Tax=Streptomyces sp. NPDC101150 TaxID=3366114 RepID=UPI0038194D7F